MEEDKGENGNCLKQGYEAFAFDSDRRPAELVDLIQRARMDNLTEEELLHPWI